MGGRFISLCAGMALLTAPMTVSAKSASNLADLIGARAAGAEMELERRGFFLADGHKSAYSSYSYWWNPARRDCVMVQTRDGRYASIVDVSKSDCNQKSRSSDDKAAAAVAVGAILGAAILAHKSGHHDDSRHYSDSRMEAEYERGFRDGLHFQAYHNYSRTDAYSTGYRNGVEQRDRETSHRQDDWDGAGYAESADISDLVGSRAAGAETALEQRGFRNVDGFQSGSDGRGSVWWNDRTRQCVQTITVGGHIDSLTDIRTHPRCR